MCLILFAWDVHADYRLVFAGNRDEAYDRPTAPAEFWCDDPRVFGGRDLEKGGTWLGVSLTGRMAAVTNFRERPAVRNAPRSRGDLAARFLRGEVAPGAYLEGVARSGAEYGAFSVVVGDGLSLWYYSNRGAGARQLSPGVYGLSNHLIDTPWPKVAAGKERLARLLGAGEAELTAALFEILLDRAPAPDGELPDTGVGIERERELSPLFIAGERYGTRASTVMLVDRQGAVHFVERTFGPCGAALGVTERRFALEPAATREAAMAAGTRGRQIEPPVTGEW